MKLEGNYTFEAPQQVVWESLMDPEILARTMPGCEKLDQVGENEYEGVLNIRVGPVQGKFKGKVLLSDLNQPDSYTIEVNGQGPAGFVKGSGEVQLEAQGDSTEMQYAGEAQVGGKIAGVGQRLLDSSAKALTRQSLDGLHQQIKARLQPASEAGTEAGATASPAPVAAPSQTEFAMGVAKNMLEDMVPPERRPLVLYAALGVVGLLIFLNWWGSLIAQKTAREMIRRR